MSCNCQKVRAQSITLANGNVTITLPATTEFIDGTNFCIVLNTNIPAGTDCCTVQITNGTDTYYIMNHIANYFRPCKLRCKSILQVIYLADPSHFLIKGIRR
jgi:hypothetical protein